MEMIGRDLFLTDEKQLSRKRMEEAYPYPTLWEYIYSRSDIFSSAFCDPLDLTYWACCLRDYFGKKIYNWEGDVVELTMPRNESYLRNALWHRNRDLLYKKRVQEKLGIINLTKGANT